MRYKTFVIILIFIIDTKSELISQSRTMLVFDLQSNTIDSIIIDVSSVDTSKQNDFTSFFVGDFNSSIEYLEQETPTENLIEPNAKSTKRRKAHLDYDLNSFPLRTSVKTSYIENDTMKNLCSGSIISRRHVLTAAHCHFVLDYDSLFFDSLVVCPVYNNGEPNFNFDCIKVSKIYSFKDWTLEQDVVILELEEELGQETGWIGIGYETIDSLVEDFIVYKFEYPSRYLPNVDSTQFNGDTLYYRYGRAKAFRFTLGDSIFYRIGLQNNHAVNGESGGSLINIVNNNKYVSYGVLSNGPHSFHSMIAPETFYVINQLIKDDINTSVEEPLKEWGVSIFPNPTREIIYFDDVPKVKNIDVTLTDVFGNTVLSKNGFNVNEHIDLSHLPNGSYFVLFSIDSYVAVRKIVKLGN